MTAIGACPWPDDETPGQRIRATAGDAAPFCRDLAAELRIPPLRACGVTTAHIPALVEQSAKASSMKANPLPLTSGELTEILERAR